MLYIPFRSGRNGRKISYRQANRYEAPPCSTSAKISACFGLFRPFRPVSACFGRITYTGRNTFLAFLFIYFFSAFSSSASSAAASASSSSSASAASSALLLLLLLPPNSLSVSVPLVDCPKNYCNFTACNEKPKQLSINFYLYGQLMLPLFKWAAKF